jgi:uncharacterized protein YggT (Ycf19 family)
LVSREVLLTSRDETEQARFARVSSGGGQGLVLRCTRQVGAAKPRLRRIVNQNALSAAARLCRAAHSHRAKQLPPNSARITRAEGASDGLRRSKSAGLRTERAKRSLMGDLPQSMLLADTVSRIESFVDVFIGVYILLILAFIILSWIRLPYSTWLNRIQRFLYDVCDPYLRLFRRFVPPVGPLDLSPLIGVLVLVVLQQVLHAIFNQLQ